MKKSREIRQEVEIDLYHNLVVPILLYDCENWGMVKQE